MTPLSLIGLQSQDQQFSQCLPLWNLRFPSYVTPAPIYDTSLLDPRRLFWSLRPEANSSVFHSLDG